MTEAEILDLAAQRFGSLERARQWFETQPILGFGTRTAKQLVEEGHGAYVAEYLAAVDAGVYV